jgi:sugar transferase (PEP-CTERM/EpsH1 system associated)
MKILVLTLDVPATNNMPGSPRLFNLCRNLARQHRITLLTPCRSQERYLALRDDPTAAGVFERILVLPEPPAPSWWGTQVHRLRQEVHFSTRYRNARYHAEQCRYVRKVFLEGGFDVFYVDTLPVAQYMMDAGLECPAIIDLHDCLTLLLDRAMRIERNWLRKLKLYLAARSMASWERSLSRVFSTIITNSPVDEEYLKSVAPAARTLTIGNGVDTAFFSPTQTDGDMRQVIFTGVMDYPPNEDAAIHFAENILPLIRQRRPEVEFWVVGKDPTERVSRLREQPGVHVTGGVPDVRPYLEKAGIFVCPLRYGSGVKNKLLAALAMQKPVVATRRSLDGLELRENQDLLVGDEPAEFAAKVVQLIEDPVSAQRLASSGRAFVQDRYSWESSARALEDVLREAVRQRSQVNT